MNKSILLIDDEEIIRETLGNDLKEAGYDVCTDRSGEDAIICFQKKLQDLVIVDLIMGGMSGIDTIKAIRNLRPTSKIIILTGYGTRESAIEALRLGVSDYLIKPCDRKELLKKVFDLLDPNRRPESSLGIVFSKLADCNLTPREEEICKMLLAGQSREEISSAINISKNTVDTHVKNFYKKLNVCSFPKLLEKLL
jgi:DNA-binding NarL/FixJ family response regulator